MIERAREDIAGERERAIAEIRREVGSLAVDLAGRVIGDTLDRERQLSLVDRYIEELRIGRRERTEPMSVADPFRESADRAFAGADHGELLRAGEGLFALAGLVDHEPRLRKALTDPAVSAGREAFAAGEPGAGRVSDVALAVAGEVVGARLRENELAEALDELAAEAVFTAAERERRPRARRGRGLPVLPHLRAGRRPAAGADRPGPSRRGEAGRGRGSARPARVADETLLLVRELIARGRAHDLDRALAALAAMAAARRGRIVAEVRSAVELDEGRRQRLAAALAGGGRPPGGAARGPRPHRGRLAGRPRRGRAVRRNRETATGNGARAPARRLNDPRPGGEAKWRS